MLGPIANSNVQAMELRQFAQCAYRAAARSSPTLLANGAKRCQARQSPLLSAIPSSARLISNSPNNSQAPPRSGTTHGSSANQGARRAPAAMPPRPPPAKSPWASRESAPAAGPAERAAAPDTLLKDASDLPGLIRWDVNAFLQRNQMKSGPPEEMRLRPSTGRTVYRTGNVDVARSFQVLNRLVKVNKVKQDLQKQRFHERPGLKRKRQKSERWRKRFHHGFRAMVHRVVELRNQGW